MYVYCINKFQIISILKIKSIFLYHRIWSRQRLRSIWQRLWNYAEWQSHFRSSIITPSQQGHKQPSSTTNNLRWHCWGIIIMKHFIVFLFFFTWYHYCGIIKGYTLQRAVPSRLADLTPPPQKKISEWSLTGPWNFIKII